MPTYRIKLWTGVSDESPDGDDDEQYFTEDEWMDAYKDYQNEPDNSHENHGND